MTRTEPLYALVYISTATVTFDDDGLAELLRKARDHNQSADITGMLLYRAGQFVQFLEGPRAEVQALLYRITADPRHQGLRVLVEGEAEVRQFSDWTMGYEPFVEPDEPLPEGFRDAFDDLDEAADPALAVRVTQQISLWFRVRSRRRSPAVLQSA